METLRSIRASAKRAPTLRLGQYFCNTYIKGSWPELFYEKNDNKAAEMIRVWLADHSYTDSMPPVVGVSHAN